MTGCAVLGMQVMLGLILTSAMDGSGECSGCARCRAAQRTTKVCRLKVEENKVEIVCWGCATEEFCVPGPSTPKRDHCEIIDCGAGADKDSPSVSTKPKKFLWTEWIPGCSKIFTRKKLMKRTVEKSIPAYRWVVEDVCAQCKGALVELPQTTQTLPAVPADFQHLPRFAEANHVAKLLSGE
jgi:hypothetical protein